MNHELSKNKIYEKFMDNSWQFVFGIEQELP